jgi:hypothetical protein
MPHQRDGPAPQRRRQGQGTRVDERPRSLPLLNFSRKGRTTSSHRRSERRLEQSGRANSTRGRLIDLAGKRFGRLQVIARHPQRRRGCILWLCLCDCGAEHVVLGHDLRRGATRSCGCLRRALRRTHGLTKSRAYWCYHNMLQRCFNPDNPNYPNYGGRNITVCHRWLEFEGFLADMGEPPHGMSIDRVNVDGDYSAWNCQWATARMQARNRRPKT